MKPTSAHKKTSSPKQSRRGTPSTIFKAVGYPLKAYQKPRKIHFPAQLPIAFAVCSLRCGNRQHIVDGNTQICEYCGHSMFRTEVRMYSLASS